MRSIKKHGRKMVVAAGLLAATLATSPHTNSASKAPCDGSERWMVKTLQDADADQIDTSLSKSISIEEVIAKTRPDGWSSDNKSPRLNDEFDVYKIRGKIIFVKPQTDGDIHIEMSDGKSPEHVVIVEIPDPTCPNVKNSGFVKMFRKVKNDWVNKYQDKTVYSKGTFEVRGILFHDKRNHGNGGGPEGVELHPVVSIKKI